MEYHWYEDYWAMPRNLPRGHEFFIGYYQTQRAVHHHVAFIHTDQSCFLSTHLFDQGYRIFLHFKSGTVTEVGRGENPALPVWIDSVAFECEPLSYPPLLRVTMQGTPLRILLDFDRYYDDDDRVELAEEAKAEDYSLLLISMPKIEQDTEFTPDRLQSALQDNDRTEWVFSRLEEQWKQKYYAVAVSPPEHGTGNLCPISFGKYKGKYSARWIDCAHCHFNVAQPPCCLCVAGAGIQKKEDFKRDLQDRLFDIDKIRRTNEEEIRLREERERSFERRSVYPRPTPYAARPVVPAGPTQEELDAEYIRICQSYDPTSDEWTVDRYNRRWIMCTVCGRIKQDAQMSYYGGKGGANRGVCADCSRNGRS